MKYPHETSPPQKRYRNLGVITTQYGQATRFEKSHHGVDIANKKGTPVPAFSGGRVVSTLKPSESGGLGNSVIIVDENKNKHIYSHLQKSAVTQGEKVKEGQIIGKMGNTGNAYSASGKGDGTHLDYRIIDAYGRYKNPLRYLKKKIHYGSPQQ